MSGRIVIYGATGYTGKLIAARVAETDLSTPTLLAGRNAEKLEAVAGPLGLEHRATSLDDAAGLDRLLDGAAVVLHVAGPFSSTYRPMVDACLRTATHYLDITGEIAVFEALGELGPRAAERGVMLMPGVGFDVVPTDCLAAHLAARLPAADDLRLFISGLGSASRGTMKSGIESLGTGTRARRGGRIVSLPKAERARRDFGDGERDYLAVGWGDVATAYHTTGIPNVTVYFESQPQLEQLAFMSGYLRWLVALSPVQRVLKAAVDRRPEGPSERARRRGRVVIDGEVRDASGGRVHARLETPEGYTLTARTALEIARRAAAGDAEPGFRTPAGQYGADFILDIEGCTRHDAAG